MDFTETLVETDSRGEHTLCTMLETTMEDTTTFLIIFLYCSSNVKRFLCKGELRQIPIIKNVKCNWLCEIQGPNPGMIFGHENTMYISYFYLPQRSSSWVDYLHTIFCHIQRSQLFSRYGQDFPDTNTVFHIFCYLLANE